MRLLPAPFVLAAALALLPFFRASAQPAAGIPARPEKLVFPPLKFEPPNPADYRIELKSGPVAYLVPDRELPLVNIVVHARSGRYLVPPGKEGLAGLAGNLLARGGTQSKTAEELEEQLDFLAAELNSNVGDTEGSVTLNLLAKDLDEGLGILREVLTAPRFQQDKLDLAKQQTLQELQQRNDDSSSIEAREASFLAYGEAFWGNRLTTAKSLAGLTRADLQEFHHAWFAPANFIVAVNGDFDRQQMTGRLEKLFADWPFPGEKPGSVPSDTLMTAPGVYLVDKDVNQGRVSMMLPGIRRDDPDYMTAMVLNDILGGGGFTARLMTRVRSDEGLAYGAYSSFPGGVYYPLVLTAAYQSKSRSVAYAASIVLEEMRKLASGPPAPAELEVSKNSFIQSFPSRFATKGQIANTFAEDEFTGRYAKDPDYWKNFRARIAAVTAEEVQRVAAKYFTTDKMAVLIVGQKTDILKGDPDHPVDLAKLAGDRLVTLPLRDPLTLEPLSELKPAPPAK
jgi:zinc protease